MPNERTDVATLAARLDAVERALTGETRTAPRPPAEPGPAPTAPESTASSTSSDLSDASDVPGAASRRSDGRPADADAVRRLERRVEELTAELDAVRGLLGGVEAVNESVERRADLALAAVEAVTSERGGEALVVERLPDEDGAFGDPSARDVTGGEEDPRDDSEADSLAARLREAL